MTSPELFSYLVQTTIAVSVLIGIVLLVRRPFAKAFGVNTAYLLWAIPAARLFMPPLPANWTLFGVLDFSGQSEVVDGQGFDEAVVLTQLRAFDGAPAGSVISSSTPSLWAGFVDALPPVTMMFVALWALGAVFVFSKLMLRQWCSARVIKAEAVEAGPSLQTCAVEICQMIELDRNNISVQTSLISSGPLVSGLTRPVVLLPTWFEEDYTGDEQRLAILHEMMHIKRGDLWALLAASFAISLQWFNPLAWLALGLFRQDQEAACDADVIELGNISPRDYGATLVKAVRKSGPVAQPVRAASLPLNHALYERLLHMKNPLPTAARRKTGHLLAASVGTAALVLSACAVSSAQTTELDGADVAETEFEARTVFIQEETVELDGGEAAEGARVRIVTRSSSEGDGGQAVHVFSGSGDGADGQSTVIVGEGGNSEMAEAMREFSEEMRRLQFGQGDNREEFEALRADFEARMKQLGEEQGRDTQVRVMRFDGDTEWIAHDRNEGECSEGQRVTSTVVIERDGEREEQTVTSCGGLASEFDVDFDVDEIMTELRASGQLSEEKLAEIEVKLAEAREKLAGTQVELEAMDFDFDVDVDVTVEED